MGKLQRAAHEVSGARDAVCRLLRARPFAVVALCLLPLWPLAGCSRSDSECLARIARNVAGRMGDATAEIKDSLGTGWQDVCGELGVEARVTARLRWDKSLADAAIEVKLHEGEIELKGTVKDPAQKQRAVEIAGSTAGVEKVADHLQLQVDDPK